MNWFINVFWETQFEVWRLARALKLQLSGLAQVYCSLWLDSLFCHVHLCALVLCCVFELTCSVHTTVQVYCSLDEKHPSSCWLSLASFRCEEVHVWARLPSWMHAWPPCLRGQPVKSLVAKWLPDRITLTTVTELFYQFCISTHHMTL